MNAEYMTSLSESRAPSRRPDKWAVIVRPRQNPSKDLISSIFARSLKMIGSDEFSVIFAIEQINSQKWHEELAHEQLKSELLILDPSFISSKSLYEAPSYAVYRHLSSSGYAKFLFIDDIYLSFYLYQAKRSFSERREWKIAVAPGELAAWNSASSHQDVQDSTVVRERMERECLYRSDYIVVTSQFQAGWIQDYAISSAKIILVAPLLLDQSFAKPAAEPSGRRFIVEVSREPLSPCVSRISDCLRCDDELIIVWQGVESHRRTVVKLAADWGRKCSVSAVQSSDFYFMPFSRADIFLFIEPRLSVSDFFYTVLKMRLNYFAVDGSAYASLTTDRRRIFQSFWADIMELNNPSFLIAPPDEYDSAISLGLSASLSTASGDPAEAFAEVEPVEIDVSVCICHFDRPKYLLMVLDAVNEQTADLLEILIVDDGSKSEESRKLIDELTEGGFRCKAPLRVIRTPDIGLGAARNAAAAQATGKYILFLDDDNIPLPDMVKVLRKAATISHADALTCLSYQYEGFDYAIKEESKVAFLPLGGIEGLGHFFNCFGDANCLMRLQSLLDVGGFATTRAPSEDWELFARMTLHGMSVHVVPEVLLAYRANDYQSLTTRTRDDKRKLAQITDVYFEKYHNLSPMLFSSAFKSRAECRNRAVRYIPFYAGARSGIGGLSTLDFHGGWVDLSVELGGSALSASSVIFAVVSNPATEAVEMRFALICDSLDGASQAELCSWFVFRPGYTFVELPIFDMTVEVGIPNISSPRSLYFGGIRDDGSINVGLLIE